MWELVSITHLTKIKLSALVMGAVMVAGLVATVSAAEYSVGSGPDDWWTSYPDQSPASGSAVSHPDWVLDALEDKPVLIYSHLECSYCVPQTEAINEIVDEYGDDIEFYEILGDGSDERIEEAFAAYDPNGGTSTVPLTVIVTLVAGEDGGAEVAWHSTEEVTGKEWIEEYVQDAIDYHEENVGDWDA
ncbi:thioredoxin family protein [Methanocrinis sp.]|uniref:thioredoxin family protein n=1 Tax=Methanocrinis sp. TaxID=3101522 RepID=UPI003D11150A